MPNGGKLPLQRQMMFFDEAYSEDHPEARPGKYVKLSVSDNGVGKDKEMLEHIFEPFIHDQEVGKGTGLGLATIYGIISRTTGS